MSAQVHVSVPATTANLGPGFDCLGLALDLWNETTFTLEGDTTRMTCIGEGHHLPLDERNLILQAMRFLRYTRRVFPRGVAIHSQNAIPVSSGLGSSAAAILTGLLGASALLNSPLTTSEALTLAARMEGHADNAAASLLGGLTVVATGAHEWLVRQIETPELDVVVILPALNLSTHTARAALPEEITLRDATYNLGHAILVVEALRTGTLDLLHQAIDDRLHLPFRLPLIPGGQNAIQRAVTAGASAVTISGAGPSLIAFVKTGQNGVAEAMTTAFAEEGVQTRAFLLKTTAKGARVNGASFTTG